MPWIIVVILVAFVAYLQGKYLFCSSQLQSGVGEGGDTKQVEQVEKLKFELSNAQKQANSYKEIASQYNSLLEKYNVKGVKSIDTETVAQEAPASSLPADGTVEELYQSSTTDWIENTKKRVLRAQKPPAKLTGETPDDSDIHFVMSTGTKRVLGLFS